MKKLLMTTDLSARSDRALERAIHLAREHDAELTIVHVVDEDLRKSIADSQEKSAREAIQDLVDTLTTGDGPQISIEVLFGKAHADILDLSKRLDAELIVLGMHREDAFKDMFRGTTAERVIRASNVPILLVKERTRDPYRQVLVGVDFSVYSRRAIEFAVKLVPAGQFHLVHAYDVPFKGFLYGRDTEREVSKQQEAEFQRMVEEEMGTFLSTLRTEAPKLERIMRQGLVRDVIHQQVDGLKPDLLVVGTHGRTGVAGAFLGSVAEDLLRNPPCDVLAVPAW